MNNLNSLRQEVLDHCRSFFLNRYMNYNRNCPAGWGNPSDPTDRCALGSMVKESFEHYWQYKLALAKTLRVNHTDNLLFPSTFYGLITRFNDLHSGKTEKTRLTIPEINNFLASLAAKYDLEYSPIMETKTDVNSRINRKNSSYSLEDIV